MENIFILCSSPIPKFEKSNTSSDDLAEAASKITLLSPGNRIKSSGDLAEATSEITLLSLGKSNTRSDDLIPVG